MQKYGKSARKKCKNERKLHEIGATLAEICTEKMQNRRRLSYAAVRCFIGDEQSFRYYSMVILMDRVLPRLSTTVMMWSPGVGCMRV